MSNPDRERMNLLLIDDARRGLEDIAAGRTQDADAALCELQRRRAEAKGSPVPNVPERESARDPL